MSAKTSGESYFQLESENESPERFETVTHKAIQMVLNTLEKAIIFLVNQSNDKALQALQACTGELFKRAAECRKQGKKMEV